MGRRGGRCRHPVATAAAARGEAVGQCAPRRRAHRLGRSAAENQMLWMTMILKKMFVPGIVQNYCIPSQCCSLRRYNKVIYDIHLLDPLLHGLERAPVVLGQAEDEASCLSLAARLLPRQALLPLAAIDQLQRQHNPCERCCDAGCEATLVLFAGDLHLHSKVVCLHRKSSLAH